MAAARRNEACGLRDSGFIVPCLASCSSISYGRGGEEDFSRAMTDLCRMTFAGAADGQIDASSVGSGCHWLTVDDSPIHPTQSLLPPQLQGQFANTELLLQREVGVLEGRGVGGIRAGGGRDVGGSDRSNSMYVQPYSGAVGGVNGGGGGGLAPQTLVCDSAHGSNPLYYPDDAFERPLGGGICNAVLPGATGSSLSNEINLSQTIARGTADENAALSRLGELHYLLDIPLLSDDDDPAMHENYLMLTDELNSLSSGSLVGETTERMQTSCQQVLGQLTIPQISSGCTVASMTKQLDNESIVRYLNDGYAKNDMQRISEASESCNAVKSVPTGSRKVLKANRRLKEKSTPTAAQPMTQTSVPKPIGEKSNQAKVSQYVMKCLVNFGICVVDRYMGVAAGTRILNEVQNLETMGLFQDGQLICQTTDTQTIRGDKIMWVERDSDKLEHITVLIRQLDNLLESLNGQLIPYRIKSRSKAMVACYPGHGRGYMRHVDNATQDGRCITCIYYLNKDWNAKVHGGLLRMFPVQLPGPVDVEPIFDRLLLFWSDHRNPHEVQPAYRDRYAITVWYFDDVERKQARLRYMQQEVQGHYGMHENRLSPISLSCGSLSTNAICDN